MVLVKKIRNPLQMEFERILRRIKTNQFLNVSSFNSLAMETTVKHKCLRLLSQKCFCYCMQEKKHRNKKMHPLDTFSLLFHTVCNITYQQQQ